MRRVAGGLAIAAAAAFLSWRNRGSLAGYWSSFKTFSVPSARLYDAVAARVLLGMYSGIARELFEDGLLRGSVLDVGCGPGGLALRLAEMNPSLEVTGVDISPEMVDLAASNVSGTGLGERVRFRAGDSAALPFPAGQFDLVVSSLSLHHWPDTAQGLREIHRVLKPGGRAAIYDVANWLMHIERRGQWLDSLAADSPFGHYSLKPVWGIGPVPILWRLSLGPAAQK